MMTRTMGGRDHHHPQHRRLGAVVASLLWAAFAAEGFRPAAPTIARSVLSTHKATAAVETPVTAPDPNDAAHILGHGNASHVPSTLQRIVARRVELADAAGDAPIAGPYGADARSSSADSTWVVRRLRRPWGARRDQPTLCAEFKRASPSKGVIAKDADIAVVATEYAEAGAALISVLTEPEWFGGSLEDMAAARRAAEAFEARTGRPRPAILRKDMVAHERMIREAKAYGADAVLLIAACLAKSQLQEFVRLSLALGLEPIVEAHTEVEMRLSLESGARVVGVNNRNLHTFALDMDATRRLADVVADFVRDIGGPRPVLASLSGVAARQDVLDLCAQSANIDSVLVGEALMRAPDKRLAASRLLGIVTDEDEAVSRQTDDTTRWLAKVCGVTTVEDALTAARNGADLIGVIFAPTSPRRVDADTAASIVTAVRKFGERTARWDAPSGSTLAEKAVALRRATARGRPLVVGVVQDQPLRDVLGLVESTGVDLVQLHGREDAAFADAVGPHIRVLHSDAETAALDLRHLLDERSEKCQAVLVDASGGGTGRRFDWAQLAEARARLGDASFEPLIAGGIDADAVREAAQSDLIIGGGEGVPLLGFDASSKLETAPGHKDADRVVAYLAAVAAEQSSRGEA